MLKSSSRTGEGIGASTFLQSCKAGLLSGAWLGVEMLEPRRMLSGAAPTLTRIDPVGYAINGMQAGQSAFIWYDDLLSASNAADTTPGDEISFRIQSVLSGTLTLNGNPVQPGVTLIEPGDVLDWTPANGTAPGVVMAFTVRAFDGTSVSATNVNVPVVVGGQSWFAGSYLYDSSWDLKGTNYLGNVIFNDDETLGGSISDEQGGTVDLVGTEFNFYSDGRLTFDDFPLVLDFNEGFGSLSNTGDFIAFNPQLPVAGASDAQLGLLVNNSNDDFSNADMVGTWDMAGANMRGTITLNANGQITGGSFRTGEGENGSITGGTYTIDTQGNVTFSVNTNTDNVPVERTGAINNSGDLIIINNPELIGGGDPDLVMLVKRGGTYSNADMRGVWGFHSQFTQGWLAFDGAGRITGGQVTEEEGFDIVGITGTYSVSSNGGFTLNITSARRKDTGETLSNISWTGAMNRSKNVAAATQTRLPLDPGDPDSDEADLIVLVNSANLAPRLTTISNFTGAVEQIQYTFTGEELFNKSNAADELGLGVLSFRITSLGSGTLTINGEQAEVGDFIDSDDDVVWTPASGANGTITAFSVVASDGILQSATPVTVKFVTTLKPVISVTKTKDATETSGQTTGKGVFTIARTGATTQALTVRYIVIPTATAGLDYNDTLTGEVVIPIGRSSVTIDVLAIDDTIAEPTETVTLSLVHHDAYNLDANTAKRTATVNITDNEPTVSVSKTKDATETSGQTTGKGTFTFTRTGGTTTQPLTVFYSLSGTATEGSDYNALSGEVVIPIGKTSVTLDVLAIDDAIAEVSESVIVTLEADQAYNLDANTAKRTATVNITDNEPMVSVTATDNSATESSVVTTARATYTLARTGATPQALTVKFDLSGNATLGDDYTIRALQGGVATDLTDTVVIPAGAASIVLTVQAVDDSNIEGTESITLTLQADDAYSATPGRGQANVTIIDNDKDTVRVIASVNTAAESATPAATCGLFIIERTTAGNDPLAVNFTLPTGTGRATRGTDYTLRLGSATGTIITGNSVTIAAGQTQAAVYVVAVDDALAEPSETVVLNLTTATAYNVNSGQSSGTVTISDNEPVVSIEATDDEAGESGSPAGNTGQFRISREGNTSGNLTVNFTVASGVGQSTRGSDYTLRLGSASGTIITANSVVITNGNEFVYVFVVPVDDTIAEPTETVTLNLSNATTYTPDANERSATVTISDNEPVVSIEATDDEASETDPANAGKGAFTISRDSSVGSLLVNFTVATGIGQATRGTDYVLRLAGSSTNLTANSVSFANGISEVVVEVIPVNDALAETDETVTLNLSNATTYTPDAGARSATVTIEDNEPKVGVVASDDTATEQGTTPGEYTITRESTDNSNPLIVNFTVPTGTGRATRGSDYVLRLNAVDGAVVTANSVTIPGGVNSVKLVLVPVDDALTEVTEAAVLTLTPTNGYSVKNGEGSATVNITDNEPVVSVTKTKDASEVNPTTTGRGTFTLTRTGATTQALTVNYTVTGTATAGGDYVTLTGSAIIPAGSANVVVNVTPQADADIEGTETVIVTLTPNDNYRLGGSNTSATMNITDSPVAAQGLFGNITFTQTTFTDLTSNNPITGRTGQVTSTGTFTSTNGRTGSYAYNTWYLPGQLQNAVLILTFNGQPALNANPLTLTWTATRVDSLHNRQIQWPTSASGSSGSFDGNDSVLVGSSLIDVDGFFKLI